MAVRRANDTPTVITQMSAEYTPMATVWYATFDSSNSACPRKGPQARAMPSTAHTIAVTKPTRALSSALASCTRGLTGTHSSEVRTLFVEYSLVTVVIARITRANWVRTTEETDALPTGWSGLSLIRAIDP